jgi:hypothetical protein
MKTTITQLFEPVLVLAVASLFSVSVLADMVTKPTTHASTHPVQTAAVKCDKHTA